MSDEAQEAKEMLWDIVMDPDTPPKDRTIALEQIQMLEQVKKNKFIQLNPAIIAAVTNILGILLVLNYEQAANIVTSKAFPMIKK